MHGVLWICLDNLLHVLRLRISVIELLFLQPLELTYIQSRLRAGSLAISRDSLMDVLDHLVCGNCF